MLNTTNHSFKTNINTPATGIIQRSSDQSFFLRLHQNSGLSDKLFEPNPKYKEKEIFIIQVMLINDGYLLIECAHPSPQTKEGV